MPRVPKLRKVDILYSYICNYSKMYIYLDILLLETGNLNNKLYRLIIVQYYSIIQPPTVHYSLIFMNTALLLFVFEAYQSVEAIFSQAKPKRDRQKNRSELEL